jgi:hypothetical protein
VQDELAGFALLTLSEALKLPADEDGGKEISGDEEE